MNADNYNLMVPIPEFLGSKQSIFFQTLKKIQFTGQLIFNPSKGKEWIFYLYLGRLFYATGGEHKVRRWHRNLIDHSPQLITKFPTLAEEINPETDLYECWEYDLLAFWLNKQEISPQQVRRIINSILVEILFDITQTMEITFELNATEPLTTQLVLIDADQVIVKAWRLWQNWQGAALADRSPNTAPIVKQKDNLRKLTSQKTYEIMIKMFNGQHTLRDLAIQLQQDAVQMTRFIIPYIQRGLVELIDVEDIPSPLINLKNSNNISDQDQQVIVCVEKNRDLVETIKKTVTEVGYRFLSFDNPHWAIASILAEKPDFILLDLDFPDANGYEMCNQLRNLAPFREVPIVIMVKNITLMDKVRAKMVGCSDFLLKPVESQALLDIISKYLKRLMPTNN